MSACISREGEYSDHEAGDWCPRCGAFNEEAVVAERDRLRAAISEATTPHTDEREHVALVLRGLGLTDEPDKYSDGIHSWRCEHPDRYGKCSCFEEAIDYVLTSGLRRRAPITDEMVSMGAHAAFMAGAGAYANMFAIERWMRAALEAAEAAR